MPEEIPPRLLSSAYRYLTRRDHGREELKKKLLSRGFEAASVELALEHLQNLGYIDDLEFSRGFLRHCQLIRRLGRERIRRELMHRGISREVTNQAMLCYDREREEENLEHLARRKTRPGRDPGRVASYLVRRGYSHHDSLNAARQARDQLQEHPDK